MKLNEAKKLLADYKASMPQPSSLPADPDQQNNDRAKWAEAAILAFMVETGTDAECAIGDLIADLMHWCDRSNVDFEAKLQLARDYYKDETFDETTLPVA